MQEDFSIGVFLTTILAMMVLIILFRLTVDFVWGERYITIDGRAAVEGKFLIWDHRGDVYHIRRGFQSPYPEKLYFDLVTNRGCDTFRIEIRGLRIPVLGVYPYIIDFEEVCHSDNSGEDV